MEYEQIFSNTGYDSGDVPYTKMDICNCPENGGSGGVLVGEAYEFHILNEYPFYDIPIYVNGILVSEYDGAYIVFKAGEVCTIKLAIPEGKGYIATRTFHVEETEQPDDSIFITNTPTECSFFVSKKIGRATILFYVLNPENYVNLNYTQKNAFLNIYEKDYPYFSFSTRDPSGNTMIPKGEENVNASAYLPNYWYGTYVEFPYDYYYLTSVKINDVEQITEPVPYNSSFQTTFDFQEDSTIETETTYMPEERNYYILDFDYEWQELSNLEINDQPYSGEQYQGDTANPETFKITFKERDDRKFVSLLVANYETVEVEEIKLTPDENGVYTYNLLLDSDKRVSPKLNRKQKLSFTARTTDGTNYIGIDEISVSCDGGEPIILKWDESEYHYQYTYYWNTFTINSITCKATSSYEYDYALLSYNDEEGNWGEIRIDRFPFTFEGNLDDNPIEIWVKPRNYFELVFNGIDSYGQGWMSNGYGEVQETTVSYGNGETFIITPSADYDASKKYFYKDAFTINSVTLNPDGEYDRIGTVSIQKNGSVEKTHVDGIPFTYEGEFQGIVWIELLRKE